MAFRPDLTRAESVAGSLFSASIQGQLLVDSTFNGRQWRSNDGLGFFNPISSSFREVGCYSLREFTTSFSVYDRNVACQKGLIFTSSSSVLVPDGESSSLLAAYLLMTNAYRLFYGT